MQNFLSTVIANWNFQNILLRLYAVSVLWWCKIMMKSRVSLFKFLLMFLILLAIFIGAYFVWAMADFSNKHALSESQLLSKYTERAISRYRANPDSFLAPNAKRLGRERLDLLFGYDQLKQRFPYVPDEHTFVANTTKAVLVKYRGLLSVPDYLLIKPVVVDGRQFYSYLLVDGPLTEVGVDLGEFEKLQPIIFIVLATVLLVVFIGLFHINRFNASIVKFAQWAKLLSHGVNHVPAPTFTSSIFNSLEVEIEKSLSDISQMLAREQSFTKLASHELRTPIAVLSSNMELFELLVKDLSPQERDVLKNMESAVSDMKYQMEALLWLSREEDQLGDLTLCGLRSLVNKALQDNHYLLAGKKVTCGVSGDDFSVRTNAVIVQIILNNLVRNAYQNTQCGHVDIQLHNNIIIINNENLTALPYLKNEAGFGIGLTLVDKLVRKLGIGYEADKRPNGYCVRLIF